MPFYEYRCKNEQCGKVYTIKSPEPLTGKALDDFLCEECNSHMERKFSVFNINTGASESLQTIGPNTVLVKKKIAEGKIKSLCGCLEAKCSLYEVQITKQTELN